MKGGRVLRTLTKQGQSPYRYSIGLITLHFGKAEQPQNWLPVPMPFLAVRRTILLPHSGQSMIKGRLKSVSPLPRLASVLGNDFKPSIRLFLWMGDYPVYSMNMLHNRGQLLFHPFFRWIPLAGAIFQADKTSIYL